MVPVHFLSVEHHKLQRKYGEKKGTKVAEIYGLTSGWGLFIFWIGIWISPQTRFTVPMFQNLSFLLPVTDFSTPLFHMVICLIFLIPSTWFAVKGVREITLRTAETHRTERIVTTGVYSVVRHPQYLGGLLAHIGISFLLSAWYSLLVTPLVTVLLLLISKKEEEELIREFGREYEDYRRMVSMFIPHVRDSDTEKAREPEQTNRPNKK
jgi:protein-S-isoprenylcysteine O-methyltransferase Ste14